jgi:hypothetical protein
VRDEGRGRRGGNLNWVEGERGEFKMEEKNNMITHLFFEEGILGELVS